MQQNSKVLDVAGISKKFGAVEVLCDVSFQVDKGETVCVLGWLGACTLPNQFQRVKPKKSSTSTISAMSAAAMPAPAPAVSPLVSTTSEPAGLQYLRTL